MTTTLVIATLAFVHLLSTPGVEAKRRRVGGGGSTYCVDDQNQRVLCVNTIAGIVGGAISGLFLLAALYCIGLALWRRHRYRRRMAHMTKTTGAEDHPETSTIASGSTFTNTVNPIAEPAPAYTKFPHAEPYNPSVAPVGTYSAPQGPPPGP